MVKAAATQIGSSVSEALREVSGGIFQGANAQYIANLIVSAVVEEHEDIHRQAVQIFEIVGSLLWDSKVIQSDAEGISFCRKIIIKSKGLDEASLNSVNVNCDRLSEPLILSQLIRTKFDRESAGNAPGRDNNAQTINEGQDQPMDENENMTGFNDPFLGLEKVKANFNQFVSIDESMKLIKAAAKKRDKQLRMMKQWEDSRQPLPIPRRKHGDTTTRKMMDMSIPRFSVSVAGRELLKDTCLKIVVGRRYGLIGRNGIGKTTFISALARGEIPGVDSDVNIGCVEQETGAYGEFHPLECVLAVDEERTSLLAEEGKLLDDQSNSKLSDSGVARLNDIYSRLLEIEADKAEPEACQILDGLGLSVEMYRAKKIKELSGGWRMRVMLARVLFADPDLLCLDEPTNHLDLHAVAWLTNYIKQSQKTCIIVSHARQFLNDVCTDIMEFKDRQLKYYVGDYDAYENIKADRELFQKREVEQQNARRAHIQKFIDKFRAKTKTAAMVQSRIKLLSKLPMLESITEDPSLHFKFGVPAELPSPVMVMQDVYFSWAGKTTKLEECILQNVDFTADLSTRAAICGVNGSGKSTFLKILIGQLEAIQGFTFRHNKLKIGFFAQHHVDGLDLTKNAVQQLQSSYPEAKLSDEVARAFLGRFGITGMMALEPLFILSGGQKSRVAIAVMAFDNPHILILDEPTNHLDLDAVQALIAALNVFDGGVIIVSHDTHLLSCVVEDVYYVSTASNRLEKFKGTFEEYKSQLLKKKCPS